MIDRVNNGTYQACQHPVAKERDEYSIQSSYSFSASITIQSDVVSLGDSGSVSPLDRFDHHLKKQLDGFFSRNRNPHTSGAYPESTSPAGFAGRFLRAIQAGISDLPSGDFDRPADQTTQSDTQTMETFSAPSEIETIDNADVPPKENIVPDAKDPAPVVVSETPEKVSYETPSYGNTADRQSRMQRVENGVDKGYQDTLLELTRKKSSQTEINIVDNAYTRLLEGLEDYKQRLINARDTGESTASPSAIAESDTFSLEILTQDGDRVTVDFSRDTGIAEDAIEAVKTGNGKSTQQVTYLSESLNYAINGNIDQDEYDAITELFGDIADLADLFYSGNMKEAAGMAYGLDFDGDELKGLNLDMRSQQATYIEYDTENNISENEPAPSGISQYAEAFSRKYKNHSTLEKFLQPRQAMLDIFKSVSRLIETASMDMIEDATAFMAALMSDDANPS